jgi:hypothetical protein
MARPQIIFKSSSGASSPEEEILRIRSRARPNASDIRKGLQNQVERIKQRTAAGVDFEGHPFMPYSQGYVKRKARKLGSASPVNLRYSGSMMNGLRAATSGDRTGMIRVQPRDARKASAHVGGEGRMPVRDFLSNTQQELDQIAEEIYYEKRVRENY